MKNNNFPRYIITASIFPDDKDWVKSQIQKEKSCHKWPFRLLDGDGNVYLWGLSANKDSFGPLDELGAPLGCTDIQYYDHKKKEWETL